MFVHFVWPAGIMNKQGRLCETWFGNQPQLPRPCSSFRPQTSTAKTVLKAANHGVYGYLTRLLFSFRAIIHKIRCVM
jgi:hypothetical protein